MGEGLSTKEAALDRVSESEAWIWDEQGVWEAEGTELWRSTVNKEDSDR